LGTAPDAAAVLAPPLLPAQALTLHETASSTAEFFTADPIRKKRAKRRSKEGLLSPVPLMPRAFHRDRPFPLVYYLGERTVNFARSGRQFGGNIIPMA
jgi:hypothetical protein